MRVISAWCGNGSSSVPTMSFPPKTKMYDAFSARSPTSGENSRIPPVVLVYQTDVGLTTTRGRAVDNQEVQRRRRLVEDDVLTLRYRHAVALFGNVSWVVAPGRERRPQIDITPREV